MNCQNYCKSYLLIESRAKEKQIRKKERKKEKDTCLPLYGVCEQQMLRTWLQIKSCFSEKKNIENNCHTFRKNCDPSWKNMKIIPTFYINYPCWSTGKTSYGN